THTSARPGLRKLVRRHRSGHPRNCPTPPNASNRESRGTLIRGPQLPSPVAERAKRKRPRTAPKAPSAAAESPVAHGRTQSGALMPVFVAAQEPTAEAFGARLRVPGRPPFTRGVRATMYRGRLWTMRQYAGFGTGKGTNRRFKHLLAQGNEGLSVAFDLPTQMGYDSAASLARGEVGRVGVAIPTI